MNLLEKIDSDLISAQKERDEKTVSVLRMLKSALKNKEIEVQKSLDDEIIMEVLAKEAKKRKESAIAYEQGGRKDLAEQEMSEYEIVNKYLPEQLSEEEVRNTIKTTIAENNASSLADMGKVIGLVMNKVKGRAEGGVVSKIVKEELGK